MEKIHFVKKNGICRFMPLLKKAVKEMVLISAHQFLRYLAINIVCLNSFCRE